MPFRSLPMHSHHYTYHDGSKPCCCMPSHLGDGPRSGPVRTSPSTVLKERTMDRTGCQLSRTEPSRTRTNGPVLRSSVRTAVLNRTAATLIGKPACTTRALFVHLNQENFHENGCRVGSGTVPSIEATLVRYNDADRSCAKGSSAVRHPACYPLRASTSVIVTCPDLDPALFLSELSQLFRKPL